MNKRLKRTAAVLLSMIIFCVALNAQTTRGSDQTSLDKAIESLIAVRGFRQVMISPDGARVAWVESLLGADSQPTPNSAIYVRDLKSTSAAPHRIAAGKDTGAHAEHSVAWSPDSRAIAFLSDGEKPGQTQLYLSDAGGKAARKLTDLAGFLDTPRFSPDGKSIAFLFTENAVRAAGATQPAAPDAGVVEEKFFEQRLAVVDLASGNMRQLSPADLYVYEYDWSPDGKSFAMTAAHGNGDNNWFIAELYTMPLASGEVKSILKPSMQIAEPHFSPDGKTIAFIGGLMSDEGVTGGDIYTIAAAGGEARNRTPNMKASASWLRWLPASNALLFTEHVDGANAVARLDIASGEVTTLWTGAEAISSGNGVSLSLARDNKTSAIIRHSFAHPPEIWAGQTGAWRQLTNNNQSLQPSWGEARSVHWTSDKQRVQGWLLYPQNFDPAKRYPMVVVVHGGPASQMTPRWGSGLGLPLSLAANGYFLFFPNPRGSYGQGERFTRANIMDFGHGDLRDINMGIDEVLKTVPVDPNRIGITGWSYGGFMTMWTVTQTTRFRAAVAGAGIANWQSYYGQNGIDQWMIPYFGASVYDDPGVYAKSSPINFIKKTKTPTLVMVGDRDAECPAPQSYEFWHALKTLGVETQLVIYPNEGHAISQPEHRRDILRRAARWFDTHLK
ncbi:MAG: prolyl oligopeptidase family serine peptidase [Pyrinomonadaceae bacterium]